MQRFFLSVYPIAIYAKPNYDARMNWKQLMSDLCEVMTLKQIAEQSGMASAGHAHDLKSGKSKSCSYEVGLKLVSLHNINCKEKK